MKKYYENGSNEESNGPFFPIAVLFMTFMNESIENSGVLFLIKMFIHRLIYMVKNIIKKVPVLNYLRKK